MCICKCVKTTPNKYVKFKSFFNALKAIRLHCKCTDVCCPMHTAILSTVSYTIGKLCIGSANIL